MGDGEAVTSQRDPECGVGGGVDDAQPHPLAWSRDHGRWESGLAAIGQVQRVADVAGVIAQRTSGLGRGWHGCPVVHAGHAVVHPRHLGVVHAGHLGVVHAVGLEAGKDLVGGLPDPVGPVVEDDDGLAVVAPGLGRVLHDQHAVQPAIDLHPGVGMEEVRPGIGDGELIDESGAGGDWSLGEPGDAVHLVAERDAVPVDAGRGGQAVDKLDPE